MNPHRNDDKQSARGVRDIHDEAQRAARRRRERMGAPPHAVAHHRRGIARKFADFRTAGLGAFAAFLAVLGPGLLAGLSDDDPAGITTYSVLGTDHGYRLLWIIPASTLIPLIYTSQVVNAVLLPLHVVALQLLASDPAIVGDARSGSASLAAGWVGIALIIACVGALAWSWGSE